VRTLISILARQILYVTGMRQMDFVLSKVVWSQHSQSLNACLISSLRPNRPQRQQAHRLKHRQLTVPLGSHQQAHQLESRQQASQLDNQQIYQLKSRQQLNQLDNQQAYQLKSRQQVNQFDNQQIHHSQQVNQQNHRQLVHQQDLHHWSQPQVPLW